MTLETDIPLFRASERFALDAGSPVPLYHQLERVLLDRITKEDSLGRMLPAEKDLMQVFGVSRATVKKTLDNLVAKGLVERRRALGTKVIRQKITEDLARLSSYTEEMAKKGLSVSTQVLSVAVRAAEPDVREQLQLTEGERVVVVQRLRGTSESFPVVLLDSQIPTSFGVDEREDFSGSLYRLLEGKYKIPIEWAEEEILASRATRPEAERLGIEPGACVLVMQRVTYTAGNRPLEFVRGVYRPERYRFSIRIRR